MKTTDMDTIIKEIRVGLKIDLKQIMKEIKINYKPENAKFYTSKIPTKLSLATDSWTSIQE